MKTDTEQSSLERGIAFLEEQKYEEAVQELCMVLEEDPSNSIAYQKLGSATRALGDLKQAKLLFAEALRLNPECDVAHFELGLVYIAEKQNEKAILEFQNALKIDPSNDSAHQATGSALKILGRRGEAEAQFKDAIRLNQSNERARIELGTLYMDDRDFEQARQQFHAVLQDSPDSAPAHHKLGILCRSQGELGDAKTFLKKAVELDVNNEWAHFELGMTYFEEGKFEEAISKFRKVQVINFANDAALHQMGVAYRLRGKLGEARSMLEAALRVNSQNEWTYFELGMVDFEEKKYEEANQKFLKVLHINPENAEAHHHLGVDYRLQGQLGKAKATLEAALALRTTNEWTCFELGYICFKEKKYLEAVQWYLKALSVNPGNDVVFQNFQHVYSLLKTEEEKAEAKRSMQDIVVDFPGLKEKQSPQVYLHFADILCKQDAFDAAQACIDQAIVLSERNNEPLPIWRIVFLPTLRCNLRCVHCWFYNDADTSIFKEPELSKDQILTLFEKSELLKKVNLCISGGEIFMRRDMPEILIGIAERGANFHFFTNGCFPQQLAKALSNKSVRKATNQVFISLDGTKKEHDEIRAKGVFDKLVESVKVIQSYGVRLDINTAVQEKNKHRLDEVRQLGKEWGATYHNFEYVAEEASCSTEREDLEKTKTFLGISSYDRNTEQSKFTGFGCMAGIAKCQIRPSGVVEACGASQLLTPFLLGDLKDFDLDFDLLWQSKEARRTRRKIKHCVGCASYCER